MGGEINYRKFSPFHVLDESGRGCWEIETEIPDSLNPYETECFGIAIQPEPSYREFLMDVLFSDKEGEPWIKWTTENGGVRKYKLPVKSRIEKSTAMYI